MHQVFAELAVNRLFYKGFYAVNKNLKATFISDFPVCGNLYSENGKKLLEYFIEDEVCELSQIELQPDFDDDLEEGYIAVPVNVYYKLKKLYTGQ